MEKDLENIMYEGYRACLNGESIDSSPYQSGTEESDHWIVGYNEGLEELAESV